MIHIPSPPTTGGYRPDGLWKGQVAVEVKSGLHSIRNLRAGLLQLAYYLVQEPDKRGLLVLTDSRITDNALNRERELAEHALRSEILNRLTVALERDKDVTGLPKDLGEDFRQWLDELIQRESRATLVRWRQPADAVFLVLLNQWFERKDSVTSRWLMAAVGCSYPTVASALQKLEPIIQRTSDRSVKLWGFPAEYWQRTVSNIDRVHPTIRYADRSGQKRSPEALLRRAEGLKREDLAVGGVIAARHYFPEFDLRGTPRLDLTMYCPDEKADLSFVEQLDPALEETSQSDDSASLAIHVLRRRVPFFQTVTNGLPFTDRVSTLLDLYEARLDIQAKELLDHLVASVG